VPLSQAV